jgi:uncharacterized radical SAM superfamily protein
MANTRLSMRKVRELLQLHFVKGISARQGAKMVGIGKTAASEYITGFKASGIDILDIDKIGDNELLQSIDLAPYKFHDYLSKPYILHYGYKNITLDSSYFKQGIPYYYITPP